MSRKEKQLKVRKSVRDTGFSAQKGVSLQGCASIFRNLFAIRTLGHGKLCRGKNKKGQENSKRKRKRKEERKERKERDKREERKEPDKWDKVQ